MAPDVVADVVVVGGGPAGAVFATRMARLGHRVCLVERADFPRPRLGESLTPGVLPLLDSVGLGAAVRRAGFPAVPRVTTNWRGIEESRDHPGSGALLVDRARFDTLLLGGARSVGVRVLQPAHLRSRARVEGGWRLDVRQGGRRTTVSARLLADAAGRAGFLGGRRIPTGARTLALYAYWTGDGLPRTPRMEAGPTAWYWGVPIPDGTYNTLVFVDVEAVRTEGEASLNDRFLALLDRSGVRPPGSARLAGPARAIDATSYVVEAPVGRDHVCIGEAAVALDPLSSSGVQKSIQSALSGAIVANTLLRRPEDADAAERFHRQALARDARRHRGWAGQHYAEVAERHPTPFWTARAGSGPGRPGARPRTEAGHPMPDADAPLRLSASAEWDRVECLGAHFVERRPALRHPALDGAVAFVGGQDVSALLGTLGPGMSLREWLPTWPSTIRPKAGLSVVGWLCSRGVLEAVR